MRNITGILSKGNGNTGGAEHAAVVWRPSEPVNGGTLTKEDDGGSRNPQRSLSSLPRWTAECKKEAGRYQTRRDIQPIIAPGNERLEGMRGVRKAEGRLRDGLVMALS